MRLIAKGSPSLPQLLNQKNDGFNKCEIQLLDMKVEADKDFCTILASGVDVTSVHTPLVGNRDVTLTGIAFNTLERKALLNTVKLAQKLAEHERHIVKVVMHNDISLGFIETCPGFLSIISDLFSIIMEQSPDVIICLENITPLRKVNALGYPEFSNGLYMEDVVKVVDMLRKSTGCERFGVVLDTCHYMITKKFVTTVRNCRAVDGLSDMPGLNKTFLKFDGYIEIVHLNNMSGNGYGKGHGTGFTDKDKDLVADILIAYSEMTKKPDLVLEIREDNYLDKENLRTSRDVINSVWENITQ